MPSKKSNSILRGLNTPWIDAGRFSSLVQQTMSEYKKTTCATLVELGHGFCLQSFPTINSLVRALGLCLHIDP